MTKNAVAPRCPEATAIFSPAFHGNSDRHQTGAEEIQNAFASRPEYVLDTSEFREVRDRVSRRLRRNGTENNCRPTLRRRTSSGNGDDERPTLKDEISAGARSGPELFIVWTCLTAARRLAANPSPLGGTLHQYIHNESRQGSGESHQGMSVPTKTHQRLPPAEFVPRTARTPSTYFCRPVDAMPIVVLHRRATHNSTRQPGGCAVESQSRQAPSRALRRWGCDGDADADFGFALGHGIS
jgi:hypothetical protein